MSKLISTRQVVALMHAKLGMAVRLGKVERVIADLEKDERIDGPKGREAWAGPDEVDLVEAELRRMRAGWYQRRNVRGDFDARVDWGDGEEYVIRVPWERAWSTERGEEVLTAPTVVGTWEWPTARLTGALVAATEQDGVVVYHWMGVETFGDDERALLMSQWMTGEKVRAQ